MANEENSAHEHNLSKKQVSTHQIAKSQSTKNIDEEAQSLYFSFGNHGTPMLVTPAHLQSELQVILEHNRTAKDISHNDHKRNGEEVQDQLRAKKCNQVSNQVQIEKSNQNNLHNVTNQHGVRAQSQQQNSRTTMEPQHNFPKVSNNFARYDPNSQKGRNNVNQAASIIAQVNQNQQNHQQHMHNQNNAKKDLAPEPTPCTIVKSFAARLSHNQAKNAILLRSLLLL
ncbi:hypothetical protein H5410_004925 [Solanum commersonii]|uniref:Uncharacterized protein n=1 Tax=Solanum commersonii TaxID=4109 RepID=A0A9J6A5Y8_SOLCO|nr:hypothetical protein H5410_004925 [Solanum commersonii]